MRAFPLAFLTALTLLWSSCASTSGSRDQYLVCPYDAVWEAAHETMKVLPMTVQDKDKGLIETGWIEMAADERNFGIFGRQAFDNKERSRMTLTIKQLDDIKAISLTERRERWHLRGGVTSQANKWWPVEPSQEALAEVMKRLNAKLKERGCSPV